MTAEELDRIEFELGIELPKEYRAVLLQFPVPACAGNTDTYLWDDADSLIGENLELRAGASGGVKPWPSRFYCMGRAGGGDVYAIDLESPKNAVWWVDHSHLDNPSSSETVASLSEWLEQFIADTRQDLEGDGIDPDGSPEQRRQVEAENSRLGCGCGELLVLVVIVVVVVVVMRIAGCA